MKWEKHYIESRKKSEKEYKEYMDKTPYEKMPYHMKKIIQNKLYGIR